MSGKVRKAADQQGSQSSIANRQSKIHWCRRGEEGTANDEGRTSNEGALGSGLPIVNRQSSIENPLVPEGGVEAPRVLPPARM
jgi:hypothetical protein